MMNRIQQIEAFLKEAPDDCFLKHALALEYIKSGNEDQALALFEANLAFDPAYLATYYHLGKLMERQGREQEAIPIYAEGMKAARLAGDQHALNELKGAWEELVY
jgi:tetratricopeptide (TPR) repeat protein